MKVLHNVIILDRSGSMAGAKYETATRGVIDELKEMDKHKGELSVTQTVIEFEGDEKNPNVTVHTFMMPSSNVKTIRFKGTAGGTPLYLTIESTINKLLEHVNAGEKVLLKIFTDGADTTNYNPATLKALINKVEELHEFTVTFEGTKFDGEKVHHDIGVKLDNMSFHANDVSSIKMSGLSRSKGTMNYMESYSKGEQNVSSKGFYSAPEQEQTSAPKEEEKP